MKDYKKLYEENMEHYNKLQSERLNDYINNNKNKGDNMLNQIEQIKALYNIITKYLVNDDEMADCGWDELNRLELLGICTNYVEKFGGMDFIAYVEYCEENDVTDRISTTLAHDLNGMNQECFLPRTSGYYEKEERKGRIRGIKQTSDAWTLDINEGSK